MNSIQTEGKIIGYIVPDALVPYFASVVYEQDGKEFLRFGDLTDKLIGVKGEFKKLIKGLAFCYLEESRIKKLAQDQYAFAVSPDLILVDTPRNLYRQLERLVKEDCLTESESRCIDKFLNLNKEDV